MSHTQDAFDELCAGAKPAQGHFVSLMCRRPFYGGPEEGGWWGEDTRVVAYQWFPTEEAARAVLEAVKGLAVERSEEARREYGQQCVREMDWCDERGLDADYLPEPDGPDDYHVVMTEGLPESNFGCRHYS